VNFSVKSKKIYLQEVAKRIKCEIGFVKKPRKNSEILVDMKMEQLPTQQNIQFNSHSAAKKQRVVLLAKKVNIRAFEKATYVEIELDETRELKLSALIPPK
jgi:hypothetical protein